MAKITGKKPNRWQEFSPKEREIFQVLIQNHLNTISQISLHNDFRVADYLNHLETLEEEIIQSYKEG